MDGSGVSSYSFRSSKQLRGDYSSSVVEINLRHRWINRLMAGSLNSVPDIIVFLFAWLTRNNSSENSRGNQLGVCVAVPSRRGNARTSFAVKRLAGSKLLSEGHLRSSPVMSAQNACSDTLQMRTKCCSTRHIDAILSAYSINMIVNFLEDRHQLATGKNDSKVSNCLQTTGNYKPYARIGGPSKTQMFFLR